MANICILDINALKNILKKNNEIFALDYLLASSNTGNSKQKH